MCLELALVSQDKTNAPSGDERLADEMAARIFAMAELCGCMGWRQSSHLLREARLKLLKESQGH
jgi:hypothetical protein